MAVTPSGTSGPEGRNWRRLTFVGYAAALSFASLMVVGTFVSTSSALSCFQTPGTAAKLPGITALPGSPAWHEQVQASMRAELGLDSSFGAIWAADSDLGSTDVGAGVPLTQTESQRVGKDNDFTDNAAYVDHYEAGIPHSRYGGSYVDPANPLQLDVEFPRNDCAGFTTLQARFPDLNMVAVVSPHGAPLTTLKREAHNLDRSLAQLEHDGIQFNQYDVDVPKNDVAIELLNPPSRRDVADITDMIGDVAVKITVNPNMAMALVGR